MTKSPAPLRIHISNALLGDGYTGRLYVGARRKEVHLLLDTGSSTLAIDARSYDPMDDPNARRTDLVQEVSYGDGSRWIGSVVRTDVAVSATGTVVDLLDVSVAVAYHASAQMFGKAQGILGLAYRPLDDAVNIHKPTIPPDYSPNDVRSGHKAFVEPYFIELEKAGLVADKFAFYTRRSVVHASANPREDPLNSGYLVLGGGEEAVDLYTGPFQTAVVLSDDWYSVNLKQIIVGNAGAIPVLPPAAQSQAPTNAIVDSGTNGLDLASELFDAIVAKLSADQIKQIRSGQVSTSSLELSQWPTLRFILQGADGDIGLDVTPENYWQVDAWEKGTAVCGLWRSDDVNTILGLPLMNGYFTIFDGSLNRGLGGVKFAMKK